jgi:hypothetical protein
LRHLHDLTIVQLVIQSKRGAGMNKRTKQAMVVFAISFTACAGAYANDRDQRKACRDSTLRGLYVFGATGFNIVGGVAQPKAIMEFIRFNGRGGLTAPAATVSIDGVITRSPANGPGTYTVESDCTGSLVFGPPGPTFDLFIAPSGSEVHMIQTGGMVPGVLQGTAERVSD